MSEDWHRLANPDEIPSPALLIYPDRVVENIRRMIAMADCVPYLSGVGMFMSSTK